MTIDDDNRIAMLKMLERWTDRVKAGELISLAVVGVSDRHAPTSQLSVLNLEIIAAISRLLYRCHQDWIQMPGRSEPKS